jgi:hypothetical protein
MSGLFSHMTEVGEARKLSKYCREDALWMWDFAGAAA